MKKLIIWYLAVLSVLSVASAVTMRTVWPEQYPQLMFIIPVFFALMLGVMILIRHRTEKKGKDRSIFFLAYRVVKILLSLVLLIFYFSVIQSQLMAFAIIFVVFYLCLSMLETVLFMKGEKKS